MLFRNEDTSLQLDIVNYEFPADGGAPDSDDRNWLVLRATYREEGRVIKDSNSCLLTYELREMTAGLKVLGAGIKAEYTADFVEPYFSLALQADGAESFLAEVAFALPNTLEDLDVAEVETRMTKAELTALVDELDALCKKFPDRT